MTARLTRTQRDALRHMQRTGTPQWPMGSGRFRHYGPDSRWTERVLRGLVHADLARWVYPTTHGGVMPHIILTEKGKNA